MKKPTLGAVVREESSLFVALPALVWQLLLFYLPIGFVIGMSISYVPYYTNIFNLLHFKIIGRSLMLALITSILCLACAYPVAYYLALQIKRYKNIWLFFLMLPFWTSFLVLAYAWFFVLDNYGLINMLLMKLHIIKQPLYLLNTPFAVYMVMLYCYVPFMILPIYTVLEKLDKRLLEASRDLGATKWQTWTNVTLPLSYPGIRTGFLLVFVPSFGELAIPVLMGGGRNFYVGNLISYYYLVAQDSMAGAIFTCLSGVVLLVATLFVNWWFARQRV